MHTVIKPKLEETKRHAFEKQVLEREMAKGKPKTRWPILPLDGDDGEDGGARAVPAGASRALSARCRYRMPPLSAAPLQVVGVQAEGEGAAVHQAHVHHGAEDAGVHAGHVAPGEGDEVLVEPLGLIGRGGVGEGGAVALPAVGEERELADHEHLASHVGQAQIGLAR